MQGKEIKQNNRVAFSATFLRSIGWQDAGKKCHMRGTVAFTSDDPLFLIAWDEGYMSYVNKFNLVCVDAPGGLNADVEKSQVYGYNESYKRPLDNKN
jgi:hypothetical protein